MAKQLFCLTVKEYKSGEQMPGRVFAHMRYETETVQFLHTREYFFRLARPHYNHYSFRLSIETKVTK